MIFYRMLMILCLYFVTLTEKPYGDLSKTWVGLACVFSEDMSGKRLELRGLTDALHHEGSYADCAGIDGVRVVIAALRIAFALAWSQLHEIWLRSLVAE